MNEISRILSGRVFEGDCMFVMRLLPENSIDAVVCDPPYHLQSIVKRFSKDSLDGEGVVATRCRERADGFGRLARGFMGQTWDGGDVAFRPETWREVYRVMKPGAHLLAFSGTRTYHRMTAAIREAKFEVRDMLGWIHGQGMPKQRSLKPALEPICVARKPLSEKTISANVETWGTGRFNIEDCRVDLHEGDWLQEGLAGDYDRLDTAGREGSWGFKRVDREAGLGRWPANIFHDGSDSVTNYLGEKANFFYCAKAGKKDRRGSAHPTVKPISLLRHLCRLVTPPGGTILDPFAGSGTLAEAAALEGFDFVLIEREERYVRDIKRRIYDFAAERLFERART
jgi:site-specific DNA-methyltransferase (adenine-specific)